MQYAYAIVEAALARVHEIDESSMGAFRGRIQHLQKLGLVPARPGKGKRVLYTNDAVFVWAICLELLELGIVPAVVNDFIRNYWYYQGTMWGFAPDEEQKEKGDKLLLFNLKNLRRLNEDEEKSLILLRYASELGSEQLNSLGGRMIVLNISDLRHRLETAIDETAKALRAASQINSNEQSAT